MNAVDILKETKKLIIENGWCQRQYVSKDGCYCIQGAITRVDNKWLESYAKSKAYSYLLDAIKSDNDKHHFKVTNSITIWNDKSGRTIEDVYKLLDDAISRAERNF